MPRDVSLGSDGHCTGFPDSLGPWDWQACCIAHDAGGSDGQLLDCITSAVPAPLAIVVAVGVALMIAARPIYNWLQRIGLVR